MNLVSAVVFWFLLTSDVICYLYLQHEKQCSISWRKKWKLVENFEENCVVVIYYEVFYS